MSSEAAINGVIDALITRLQTNYAALGLTAATSVEERDEEPKYIDDKTCYVIPLAEGKDSVKLYANGEDHTYPITIVAFYKYASISTGLRPVRTYGYTALDLFTRTNANIVSSDGLHGAEASDATVEAYYWRNGDFVMHAWSLQLQIHQIV